MIPEAYPEKLYDLIPGTPVVTVARPLTRHVVLGAGCKVASEVDVQNLICDEVTLFRRKGGGGTVLLGPHTMVLTIQANVSHPFGHKIYFNSINQAIIDTLQIILPLNYREQGISDITVNNRKICGSSMYRRKKLLLFQASVLVEDAGRHMERYLKTPSKQPEYRHNRNHSSFVTNLRSLGLSGTWPEWLDVFRLALPVNLTNHFSQLPDVYK
jgi:lipoate-protein ligase A